MLVRWLVAAGSPPVGLACPMRPGYAVKVCNAADKFAVVQLALPKLGIDEAEV